MAKDVFIFGFSGSALKVIALLSMLADHCAYFFLQPDTTEYEVLRCFGRIAFPIFAFLIAEGYEHTHNKFRYFLSLLGFAVISEVPWQMLNGYCGHNVMFTLALGVLALQLIDRLIRKPQWCFPLFALVCLVAEVGGLDYGWRGIGMIAVFYMFRDRADVLVEQWAERTASSPRRHISVPALPFMLPIMQVAFAFPMMAHYGIVGAVLACAVLLLYNGERGFIKGKVCKYVFYTFYPAHLFVIWLIVKTL